MSKMNWSRVVLSGLVAGFVISLSEYALNLFFMRDEWRSAMETLGLSYPETAGALAVWVAWAFLIGLLIAWVYAAIRPRLGPGPSTAAVAGGVAWCLDCLVPAIAFINLGFLPVSMLLILTFWALVEHVVAALAGAWIYREGETSPEQAPA